MGESGVKEVSLLEHPCSNICITQVIKKIENVTSAYFSEVLTTIQNRYCDDIYRQHQVDDKWKHDLYADNMEPPSSKPKVGPKDLLLKLQKKDLQHSYYPGKVTGVRDLREKLSGIMHSQTANNDPPNAITASESSIPVKKSVNSVEKPVPETKKVSNPTSSVKMQKSEMSLEGFLKSLGLEKYIITLKVEEVDMTALMHMNEDDLKAIGIPMGPRKKILVSLQSKS